MANGLAFQGVTAPKAQSRSRYPEKLIADLIEDTRKAKEFSVPQAAEVIGLGESSWYKKADGVTPFKVEEIGRLAEAWDMPDGWPFLQIQVRGKR